MEWLNYHHLHCFGVVVREGELLPAGKVLAVGQGEHGSQHRRAQL